MSNPAKMRRLHSPSEQQSLERSNDCGVENQGQKNKRTSAQIKNHAPGKIDQLPGSSALENKDNGMKKCEREDNSSRNNEDHEEPTEDISVVQNPKDAEVCDSEIPVELNETQQDQRALVIRGRNINNDLSFSEEQYHHQTILSFHITMDWTALEGFYFTVQEQSGSILHLPSDTTLAMIRWHLSTRTLQEEMTLMQSRINIITDAQTSNHGVPQGLIITIGVHHFYMRLTNQLQEGLFYHFLQIFSRGQHASFSTRTFENTRSLSTCTVCLAAYIRGDLIRSLPCYHEFHANCIDRWLHRNSTCPVCRRTVFRSLQY